MLDDHAGAELCRFNAAHRLPRKFAYFGNSSGQQTLRQARVGLHPCVARGMTLGTLEEKTRPTRNNSINARVPGGQSSPPFLGSSERCLAAAAMIFSISSGSRA